MMDREYFDAKFDGLEKLMSARDVNFTNHIAAVSLNVREIRASLQDHKETCPIGDDLGEVRMDLQTHKENNNAHGRKAADVAMSGIVAWLGLGLAAALGLLEAIKK